MNNKIQSDKDNFLDNLIYEIAIMGVLGSIFRQDNFLTIYERFWHLGGHVCRQVVVKGHCSVLDPWTSVSHHATAGQ